MTYQVTPLPTQACDTLMILLRRIAQGDAQAMAELCEQTRGQLTFYIRRFVRDEWQAEEVLQDIYVQIWQNARDYCCDRGTPLAWIYILARSRSLDSLRRYRKQTLMDKLDDQLIPSGPGHASIKPAEIWWHARVRRGVQELPAAQERLIGLAFFEGYSHTEIAESTGLPLGTVKARIRAALNKLRDSIAVECRQPAKVTPIRNRSAVAKPRARPLPLAA